MSLIINKLEVLFDSGKIDGDDEPGVGKLLRAINDWPKPIETLTQYELEVKEFVGELTTQANIQKKMLSPVVRGESWKIESLTEVIDVFIHFTEMSSLKEIVVYLNEKYAKDEL